MMVSFSSEQSRDAERQRLILLVVEPFEQVLVVQIEHRRGRLSLAAELARNRLESVLDD
jgi:hypothetical protein